jgi:hypothetical protein
MELDNGSNQMAHLLNFGNSINRIFEVFKQSPASMESIQTLYKAMDSLRVEMGVLPDNCCSHIMV